MKADYQPKYPIVVPGAGPVPALGMIVGEAPGRSEVRVGMPFVGASGGVLARALQDGGMTFNDFYVTNVFKGDVGEDNRNPSPIEILDHAPILGTEIEKVAPVGVLTLGRFATEQFLIKRDFQMRDVVGHNYHMTDGLFIFPCYHPAATLYNRSLIEDFREAVIKFVLITQTLERARHGSEDRNTDGDSLL